MLAGMLCAEEKDYKTAFSYFYESFENYNAMDDMRAVFQLKYMLLTKIMLHSTDDVNALISGKIGLRYAGREIDAMKAIARANATRSLADFESALSQYHSELAEDPIIHAHLAELYDTMLEKNLVRLIEPFSRVEVSHIAKLIALPFDKVELKLSQMVLDKKLPGVLDQGNGCLVLHESTSPSSLYDSAIGTISEFSHVVDQLFEKSARLS